MIIRTCLAAPRKAGGIQLLWVGFRERLKEAEAPRNARLWRKLREIEKLGGADRKAVLRFVDALLAKQRLEHQRG
jgi:hypothetical protein